MRSSVLLALAVAFSLSSQGAYAYDGAEVEKVPGGEVITPKSGKVSPGDEGVKAHTNVKIFQPGEGGPKLPPPLSSTTTPSK